MQTTNVQITETLIVLVVYIVLYLLFRTVINNFLKKTRLERGTRKMALRGMQLFTTTTAIVLITGIWGFKQNEIALFAGSLLTALGIAFFAHWSLLSNITSSILIFFNHPVKIGDHIKVLHKDFNYEGEVTELNYFFVHLRTEAGETITIPNSHFFSMSISVTDKKKKNNLSDD